MKLSLVVLLVAVVGGSLAIAGCGSGEVDRTVPKAVGEKHQDEKEKRDGHYTRAKG